MSLVFIALAGSVGGDDTEPVEIPLVFGAKAIAMGGAFTAIADDAGGALWNPAGLAFSPYLRAGFHTGFNDLRSDATTERLSASGLTLGWTFMGFHYQAMRLVSSGRSVEGTPYGLSLTRVGVSLVQSLPIDNLVVGANFHYLGSEGRELGRLRPSSDSASDLEDVLFGVGATSVSGSHFDMDLGLMYEHDAVRLALNVSHITEPELSFPSHSRFLERRARAGLSWSPGAWQLGIDIELLRIDRRARELGFGFQRTLVDERLYLRGGVSGLSDATTSKHVPAFSAGVGVVIDRFIVEFAYRRTFDMNADLDGLWFAVSLGS